MSRDRNIWVIGNGFDLSLGLKTGYMDFVRRVEDAFGKKREERSEADVRFTELCNVNGFFRHFHFLRSDDESWTFFEREMAAIVEALARFQDVLEVKLRDPEFDIVEFNIIAGLFTYRDLQIFKHFARIFEQVVDDPSGGMYKLRQLYITQDMSLDKRAMINEVRRELDDLTAALDLYLTSCAEYNAAGAQSADGGGIPVPGAGWEFPDYVINMNYTDTLLRFGVPVERIFYAKGRAGSEPVDLVLGCPGESEEYTDWISLYNYFQRLIKGIGLPDREQLYPADEDGLPLSVKVCYLGYSFPESDAELLWDLFEAAYTSTVYCKDREDYAQKVLALMRIFGRETVTDAIDSLRLRFEVEE